LFIILNNIYIYIYIIFKNKYLKYKEKYLDLKYEIAQKSGAQFTTGTLQSTWNSQPTTITGLPNQRFGQRPVSNSFGESISRPISSGQSVTNSFGTNTSLPISYDQQLTGTPQASWDSQPVTIQGLPSQRFGQQSFIDSFAASLSPLKLYGQLIEPPKKLFLLQ
jgi:hypothetical protein